LGGGAAADDHVVDLQARAGGAHEESCSGGG
jgi:hypothetical protein